MSNDSLHPFQSEAHYWRLRAKLVAFLDRRSCSASEDVADEALARLVTKATTKELPNVDAAAHVIARNVFHEWLRQSGRFVGLDHDPCLETTPGSERFRLIAKIVIGNLNPSDRSFLEQYYIDGETACDLALQSGTTPVAVRGRAFRLRQQLKTVMAQILADGEPVQAFARSASA